MDAKLLAAFEHTLDRAHAGPVAEAGGPPAPAGPSPVAIHDDPDMPRDVLAQVKAQGDQDPPTEPPLAKCRAWWRLDWA
jgi:hypothetical protein